METKRHTLNILGVLLICLGWVLAYISQSIAVGAIVTFIASSILISAHIARRRYLKENVEH